VKVVGATSSEGFQVFSCFPLIICSGSAAGCASAF